MGTGDLTCIILAVEMSGNKTLPRGGTLGLINFANTESKCVTQVFNRFIEYLPYIMLFQTLILVFAEKFTFRIPRIAQRVERFYKNIVEESLFGKGKVADFETKWLLIFLPSFFLKKSQVKNSSILMYIGM